MLVIDVYNLRLVGIIGILCGQQPAEETMAVIKRQVAHEEN